MTKPLLIEIAVEELPAIPLLNELPNIEKKWLNILENNSLLCEFKFYYTPRRLVFWHKEFKIKQDNKIVEMFGAPIKIAFKDGEYTKIAIGFAKKCGVNVSELKRIDQGKGEILYIKKELEGLFSKRLLNNMVNEFVSKLNFGKSMRWGDRKKSFIRPIRGLSIILGDELIDGEIYGIKSSKTSFAHRMVSYKPFNFNFAEDYFCKIAKYGIVLFQEERKEIILSQMIKIEKENNLTIEIDKELLNEIVAITEYPTALLGRFDKKFLQLPTEVIISSMKEHQRYFAVYKNNKITNKFIVISNSKTYEFDEIIKGNEKVLRARLADGIFFYNKDLKNGLDNKGLKNITFVDGLGSIYDKCIRESKIAIHLANVLKIKELDLIEKTIMLSKADLLTDMVYEFTDLQGIMGYYYTKVANESELLYTSIKEQYLPNKENSNLPSNKFSAIISISTKLDSLMGLFSINMIPTGSRDPFALRRAATGIYKICYEHNLHLNLSSIINSHSKLYNNYDTLKLLSFFNNRLYQLYKNINPSVIKAVLKTNEYDIINQKNKIEALNPFVQNEDFKKLSSIFNRVANIIKDIDINSDLNVDITLFEVEAEKTLYKQLLHINNTNFNNYNEKLDALFALKPNLDKYFQDVFVNSDNEILKLNRKNTIGQIYQTFKTIADIKEITI
jgi:glycyl-tRNA synthetase beta chain